MYKHLSEPTICGIDAFEIRIAINSIRKDSRKCMCYFLSTILQIAILVPMYLNAQTGIKIVDIHILAICILTLLLLNYMTILVIGANLITSMVQSNAFRRAGVVNRNNEVPHLFAISTNDDITEYSYRCHGISLSMFLDKKDALESALNIVILDIRQGFTSSIIIIKAVPGTNRVPECVKWDDVMLSDNDAEIVLGISAYGRKVINIDKTPHVQAGGITGSGKSVLLRCVLHQLYLHGASIYLFDYKNLVDFTVLERASYRCITSLKSSADVLKEIVAEMEHRKFLFAESHCSNIKEYNTLHPNERLKRIIVASDEIAYAFQRKGQSSEVKAWIDSIEASITLIAQQGRFAGITLWLSTQRGDADTIPPQIRSNLTVRLCGRASDILSRVTIGSSIACEIPKSIPGRFVDDEEEFFQGFYYEED